MNVQLRRATPDDRDAVVDVFLGCWRQSYAGVIPQAAIDAMTDHRARALWTRLLQPDVGSVVVAEDERDVIGVTRFETRDCAGIVHSLYVAPPAHGLGIGTRLLHHATAAMTAEGARTHMLWVFTPNTPSIAFYRARGWLPDGVSRTQDEFGVAELRLRLEKNTP